MELQDLLNKISSKKQDEKKESPLKELIKFKEGILEKYPSAEIRLCVYPSSFGIHFIISKGKKEREIVMEGTLSIHTDYENLKFLLAQLEKAEKKTEQEKYVRILNQSKLIQMYRTKNMDEDFIKTVISSMPVEYELQLIILPAPSTGLKEQTIKIYIDNLDDANKIEKNLQLFREKALNTLLEETINTFSTEPGNGTTSC